MLVKVGDKWVNPQYVQAIRPNRTDPRWSLIVIDALKDRHMLGVEEMTVNLTADEAAAIINAAEFDLDNQVTQIIEQNHRLDETRARLTDQIKLMDAELAGKQHLNNFT